MPLAKTIAPWQLQNGEESHSPADYGWHFLAEGDSWFTCGSFPGHKLLDRLALDRRTLITRTATPGDAVDHMADWFRDSNLPSLIDGGSYGNLAWKFDAILLSGGGNDLIDAVSHEFPGGRLLRLCDPAAPPASAADCIDGNAWFRFEQYLRANFRRISSFVASSHKNRDTPVFAHTYDYPTARNAGLDFGRGPWLYPSFVAHNIPAPLWLPLTDLLFQKLAQVIRTLYLPNVHVIDTCGMLDRAAAGTTGDDADWLDEIHPNAGGYAKLAGRWKEKIEAILS
jgi:lysophospholipase L1-like esterase